MTILVFLILVFNIFTFGKAFELEVYLEATSKFLMGLDPYSRTDLHFKYPPWIISFFSPFLLLPFQYSSFLWRVLLLICVIQIYRKFKNDAKNQKHSQMALSLAFLINIGSWNSNLQGGQITLLMMYLLFFSDSLLEDSSTQTPGKTSLQHLKEYLGYIIFTLVSTIKVVQAPMLLLYGIHRRLVFSVITTALICLALLIPGLAQQTFFWNPIKLIQSWLVHGRISELTGTGFIVKESLGLPSLCVRILNIQVFELKHLILFSLLPMTLLSLLSFRMITLKKLSRLEALSTCISFSGIVGPLVFPYTFAWHFPLTYFFLKEWLSKKTHRRTLSLGLLGLIMTYVIHANTWPFGGMIKNYLFFYSTRSVGALLTLLSFLVTRWTLEKPKA